MENCNYNNKVELKSKTVAPFVVGMLLTIVSVILFFVGTFGFSQTPLWIATAVIGGVSLILLGISAHSTDGWLRMFSILFIVAITVIMTFMATITWA